MISSVVATGMQFLAIEPELECPAGGRERQADGAPLAGSPVRSCGQAAETVLHHNIPRHPQTSQQQVRLGAWVLRTSSQVVKSLVHITCSVME